ncbi:ABC transporter ATP-binding protein [Amycolatopsis jejuensis]|uniref:dipeptide ABC transporter ATP-binding protein n=1 Tax=Amycolatopsis jejuensis TaxID=330084 RepID=UPI00068F56A0|nr:ABC transporter ATP-binding protein [Amycolatopsis jejuensis]
MTALLSVRDLSVHFTTRHGPVTPVRGVSLRVPAGQCLAIVGESGSGKSVTARSLLGLAGRNATVEASSMTFEGRQLLTLDERHWRRLRGARIGFVGQDALTSLNPLRRVGDEVAEPIDIHTGLGREERSERIRTLLRDVGIPDPGQRARQYPHQLSGGLRQRALIASAIAAGPSLVIADEPTTALDVTIQAQVLDLLSAMRDAGTGVLLISHDLTVVARMADHVAVMYAGLIVEEGPAAQVLDKPVHPYTRALLAAAPTIHAPQAAPRPAGLLAPPAPGPGCPYRSRCPIADSRCHEELPPLHADGASLTRCWHAGEESPAELVPLPPAATPPGPVVLQAESVAKRFRTPDGSRQAVDHVSFSLRSGEALGVVGESGSGKSTLAQLVLGLLPPDDGHVLLDGGPWSRLPERERRAQRSRIQPVHQDPLGSFDPRFTVERIIGEALGRPGRRGAAAHRSRIVELLHRVGLDRTVLGRRGSQLSGGQRQRVAIARALGPQPEILVCDEPVSALDVSIQAQILELFDALRRDLRVALLFISHDLGVINQLCGRVLVMKEGVVVEEGATGELLRFPRHPYTRELLAAVAPDHSPAGHPPAPVRHRPEEAPQ